MRAAFIALLIAATSGLAAAKEPAAPPASGEVRGSLPARAGLHYLDARKRMVAAGWSFGPVPSLANGCGVTSPEICRDYPETWFCRGTGLAGCTFMFWKGDLVAMIETHGEEIDAQTVVRAHILSERERRKLSL